MRKRFLAILVACLTALAILVPVAMVAADDEYILFDSFEETFTDLPTGWTYFGSKSTAKVDTATFLDGKQSLRVNCETLDFGGGVNSPKYPVEAGKNYTVAVDAYVHSGSTTVYLKYFDSAGKEVGSKTAKNVRTGGWETIMVTETAPAGAVTSNIVLYILKTATGDISFDSIRVGTNITVKPIVTPIVYTPPIQTAPVSAKLVTPSEGNLIYSAYNERGEIISDFSYAGFYAGLVDLPVTENLAVLATISPAANPDEDVTKKIQEVIDQAAATIQPGQMGVVKLEAGKYTVNKSGISLKSGIVLSGSGQGPTGTVIYASAPSQHTVIKAAGGAPTKLGNNVLLTDEFIGSGSKVIHVSDADISTFNAGDLITIYHPSTDEWAKAIEMSDITSSTGTQSGWKADTVDMATERTIAAIDGNAITLDFPLYVPHDKTYNPSYIYLTDESAKITDFGIENLRVVSYYNGVADDEAHANVAIGINNAKNGFVRNVSGKHFVLSVVRCASKTKQITVQNVSYLDPISQVAGSRRYSFACSGGTQQILITGCYSYDGRHDYECSFSATGPIVFADSVSDKSNTASEAHGTWSTGMLYDNLYQVPTGGKGFYAFANRGIYGGSLSQGWTAAGCVAWNCLSPTILAHKPPLTYQNFLIGTWGRYLDTASLASKKNSISSYTGIYRTDSVKKNDSSFFKTSDDTPFTGDTYQESPAAPVEPRSLFKAQLALRLTGDYRNAKPNAPVIVAPRAEAELETGAIEIMGVYQMGAEKVTVYVDDQAHDAALNAADNTFKLNLPLNNGYHKIYVTQTINGVEGTKNADRFIKMGEGEYTDNPDYLLSSYPREKTALLTVDERQTFDEYQYRDFVFDGVIRVFVNGEKLNADVDPLERNDRVLVPMRAIFEALGAEIEWNEATATATAVLGERVVKISENATEAFVNDQSVTLDVPAYIIDGRFMVPVRFIAESFGAKVDWIDKTKTVTVLAQTASGGAAGATMGIENALIVMDATQSGDDGAGNSIKNAYDGDINSYWGVSGTSADEAWGIFDLGSEKALSEIQIAFHNGNARVYTFSIEVSTDGTNYTKVIDNRNSSGESKELEAYPLNEVNARYVKFIGGGNSTNDWNSVREVIIIEKK